MTDDGSLLRKYVNERSEAAFAEIVRRHLDFVYSTALRNVRGDSHRAQDVTQRVFSDLARKATKLCDRQTLVGWLHISAHHAAADLMRREQRRQQREQAAYLMHNANGGPATTPEWTEVEPVLDEAVNKLGPADRDIIFLRFFEQLSFSQIGEQLELSEDAAQKRASRALERLRNLLAQKGVTSTATALGTVLASNAVGAAPAGLSAIAAGVALTAQTATAAGTVITLMSIKNLALAGLAALLLAGAFVVTRQRSENADLSARLAGIGNPENEIIRLRSERRAALAVAQEVAGYGSDAAELEKLRAAEFAAQQAAAAVAAAPVIDPSKLDQLPQVIRRTPPEYPPDLKAAGITGVVAVEFIVGSDGTISYAKARYSTHPELEQYAIAAVKGWEFRSGKKGGRPVNGLLVVDIDFDATRDELLRRQEAPSPEKTDWL